MMSAYGATKHAIQSLTISAALEYATKNIRINAVAPGGVDTEMLNNFATSNGMESKAFIAKATLNYPMQRFGTSQEIADGICWLASDEASFITGHTLCIDGGGAVK
jgi:NAD(P)-dependent dehydrogenase (short-subunit alcohol dehydrogenase family)